MVTDPKGLYLYVGLGPNSALGTLLGSANVYPIDTQSGELIGPGSSGNLHPRERAMAIDPQGRFLFDGWGTTEGFIESAPISPADGTATPVTPQISLGTGNFPFAMLAESSGRFLYVQENSGAYVYPIDPTTGALRQAQGPLPALNFQTRRDGCVCRNRLRWRQHDRAKRAGHSTECNGNAGGHLHHYVDVDGHDHERSSARRGAANTADAYRELIPKVTGIYRAAVTRYTRPALSSETSNAPSGATVTPTGRPYTLLFAGSGTKPVRNG
jgi:hypothetical protein